MDDFNKLRIIQGVLNDVAGRGGYADADVADEIIERVRGLTGDRNFCADQNSGIDVLCHGIGHPHLLIEVTTWENDADHYQTNILFNLTDDDVKFYVDLCSKFSDDTCHTEAGWGNKEHEEEEYADLMLEMFNKHPNLSASTRKMWEIDELMNEAKDYQGNTWHDTLTCVLGNPVDYEGFFARVVSGIKVFAIDDKSRTDVTAQYL